MSKLKEIYNIKQYAIFVAKKAEMERHLRCH